MIKTSALTASLFVASAMLLGAGSAQAVTLDFDLVADCGASGVTITGGIGGEACGLGGSPDGSSALVRSTFPDVNDSYWTATFSTAVSNISIDLGDFNQDADRLFLWAWDANGNEFSVLEDIDEDFIGMRTLTLLVSGITSITFGTIGLLTPDDPTDFDGLGLGGIYADNLTFTRTPAVPLPAALPLLLTGLGGLGFIGWRRKRRAASA